MSLAAVALEVPQAAPVRGFDPWWDRGDFRLGVAHDQVCPESIDITGRGRLLLFSPGRPLGSGRWRATAVFELCADAGRYPYRIAFGRPDAFVTEDFQAEGEGIYEVSLECELAADCLVEMHVAIPRAAFHGELRFLGARVERLEPPFAGDGGDASP